jgi:hypothetical protein
MACLSVSFPKLPQKSSEKRTTMQLEANDLLLFARIVAEGSFSKAAARLAVPKSTLSRRITALESQLGERLLLRTTRKLSVTEFGQHVLQHAQHVGRSGCHSGADPASPGRTIGTPAGFDARRFCESGNEPVFICADRCASGDCV